MYQSGRKEFNISLPIFIKGEEIMSAQQEIKKIRCPKCGTEMEVAQDIDGLIFYCPKCGYSFCKCMDPFPS